MIEIRVDTRDAERALKELDSLILEATEQAMRDAAPVAHAALQANLSYSGPTAPIGRLGARTGRLRSQAMIKFFKFRNGLTGASIKVRGDRSHVMRFHEKGTASHGRQPFTFVGQSREARRAFAAQSGRTALPARRVFELTWKAIEAKAAQVFVQGFERQYNAKSSNL